MKYLTLFAVSAVAVILPRSEIDTTENNISNLRKQFQTFTIDLDAYDGKSLDKIQDDAENIILAISSADGDTKSMKGPLADSDAAGLAIPIQDLGTDIGKAMDALISKKSALVASCFGPEVYQSLVDQSMQSATFEKHLLARVSDKARVLAEQVAKPINENIARAIAAFADQKNVNCPVSSRPKSTPTGVGSGPQQNGTSPPSGPFPTSNGTSPTYTGTNPTATITRGAASQGGISFGLTILAILGVLTL